MKIKHLLIGLLAMAAAVACEPEPAPVETPKLEVDKTAVSVEATSGEASFSITSNQSWVATADADWVSLDPSSGEASEEAVAVKVTAEDNETTKARKAIVTVKAGELTKTVEVSQAGTQEEEPGEDEPGEDEPGEDEPQIPENPVTYTVTGTIKGTEADKKANYWNSSNEPGLMTLEGDYYVAKNVEFDYDYTFSDNGSGEDFVKFKICETGTDNAYGQAEEAINKPNTEIAVQMDGVDIYLDRSGVYDVYFDKTNAKVWVMEAGYKPGEEIAILDGCQWKAEMDGMPVLFDLGIAEEEMLSIALPTMDESGFALHMIGFYEIEATDKSSGVISFTQYDWEWDEIGEEFEIQYSELTVNSVKFVCENVFGVTDPITLTRVEEPYEIQLPGGGEGGGDGPEGPVANGKYWFTNNGKVMAPMAEDATSGKFPAEDLAGNASTDKNAFTFTYNPNYTAYTIQDSYGRYLGQTDYVTGNAVLTTDLPAGDDYAYYLWVIDNSYEDGTVDVYNLSTYFGIGYFADSSNWYLSEETYTNAELRPTLVSAQ